MGESFEPDHPRYHHAGCCDAHVVNAARSVAIISLIAAILRTLFMFEGWWEQSRTWNQLKGATSVIETISITLLLIAVYKDIWPFIFPYLVFQNFIVVHLLYTCYAELTGKEFNSRKSTTILLKCAGRICWTAVSAYFCYILINYLRFLKRRTEAYKDHERGIQQSRPQNARQTIFEYQLAQGPQTTPVQQRALIPQYQAFPTMQVQMFEPPPPYEPRVETSIHVN